MKGRINDVWLKASIIGANWAAIEIVLGSFLHNLHVPFKGNFLTAIGLILMISVAGRWQERGLFWRSGLICALMKSISPSAVIFGPMIAIFMEALLLEAGVRILGRSTAGFLLGSVLAMAWTLVQKILNLILLYGLNIVDLYNNILAFAEKQMDIAFANSWMPLFIILCTYMIFGAFSAIIGMRISRTVSLVSIGSEIIPAETITEQPIGIRNFPYSIYWLAVGFAGIIASLLLTGSTPVFIWLPFSLILMIFWAFRYKRAMRKLTRPRFWIYFAIFTFLPALLLSYLNGGENAWSNGLLTGLQMNTRAAVVILGFSMLGTELYNPGIRNYLSGSVFRSVPVALEAAFESLPFIIANLPTPKSMVRKPLEVVALMLRNSENRFRELKEKSSKVIIVSGNISEGKTSFIQGLIGKLKSEGIPVAGIYSPKIQHNGVTIGYDIVDIESNERFSFLRLNQGSSGHSIGRFNIEPAAMLWGDKILSPARLKDKTIIIIDEIGKLELNGGGWKNSLEKLLKSDNNLIITVRTDYVDRIIQKFVINDATVYPVNRADMDVVVKSLRS